MEPPAKKPRAHPATTADSAKKQTLAVSQDLLQLFIELDEMDDTVLKKAVLVIRNQLLETACLEQVVEVTDVDATTNNFDDIIATPKVPSLGRIMGEVVAAPVATPILAIESPTPKGTPTEEVVAPSPVKNRS